MALLKIGFNEGSLLRRILLHVGTFVLGAAAFVGLVSFVLVSLATRLVPSSGAASDGSAEAKGDAPGNKLNLPLGTAPPRRKPAPGVMVEHPNKDE